MEEFRFGFESYGVRVLIESNSADILASARSTVVSALLGNVTEVEPAATERKFSLQIDDQGVCSITQDGKQMVSGEPDHKFWKYFDSLVRILVAEWTRSLVFIHAGAVGWRGKAIIFPGSSFFGKTTLVAELVRRGAAYLSDEYAILDENGVVHPFARRLSIRNSTGSITETPTSIEALGGQTANDPLPVGLVLFTKFEPGSEWKPQLLTLGEGIMQILPQTIAIRRNSEFAINVLKKAVENAIIVQSPRFEAAQFAEVFLEFVDNTAF